jgi:hypothetical protein
VQDAFLVGQHRSGLVVRSGIADFGLCNKTRWERPNLYYPLIHPVPGEELWPKETRVWAFSEQVSRALAADHRLWWRKGASGACRR